MRTKKKNINLFLLPNQKMTNENTCHVNELCIGCGVCVAVADQLFAMENGHSKMIKQPASAAEVG